MSQPVVNCWLPEFLQQVPDKPRWLIEPLIPQGGTIFLHGPTSCGKSPLSWMIATCVSEGLDFFGYPVTQVGPVLYIELDTPAPLVHDRLSKLQVIPKQMFLAVFEKPLNILAPTPEDKVRLLTLARDVQPVLVIVNTLIKSHAGDDKESSTPSQVYGAWRAMFPGATLLFIHHDRKTPVGIPMDREIEDQLFSGSQHWMDDAQVALHLRRTGKKVDGQRTPVMLRMTKSQVSDHEALHPINLILSADGTNWEVTGPTAYRRFFLAHPELPKEARVKAIMAEFGIEKSAAYAAVKGLPEEDMGMSLVNS